MPDLSPAGRLYGTIPGKACKTESWKTIAISKDNDSSFAGVGLASGVFRMNNATRAVFFRFFRFPLFFFFSFFLYLFTFKERSSVLRDSFCLRNCFFKYERGLSWINLFLFYVVAAKNTWTLTRVKK